MGVRTKYVDILIVLAIGLLIPTQVLALSISGDQRIVVIAVDYNDTTHIGTKQQISDKVFVNVRDYVVRVLKDNFFIFI